MNEELQDKNITCAQCGHDFLWPVKDQLFYKEKGFMPPKRCKNCRKGGGPRREQ